MNQQHKAVLLGFVAALLSTGGVLLSSGATAFLRAVGFGCLSLLAVSALATWLMREDDEVTPASNAAVLQVTQRAERTTQKFKAVNVELSAKLVQKSSIYAALMGIAKTIGQSLAYQEVLDTIMEAIPRTIGVKRCSLWLTDPGTGKLKIETAHGWVTAEREAARAEKGVIAAAVERKVTMDCESIKRDHVLAGLMRESKIPSMVCAPLVLGGEVLGALNIEEFSDTHKTSMEDDVRLITFLASIAAMAIKNSRLFEGAQGRANTDGLTRLFNHRYFQDTLDEEIKLAEEHTYFVSVVLSDIDHFKRFNDTHGHQIGDLVLRETATCFKNTVTEKGATIARYGGEEFIVILPYLDKEEAGKVAERLRQAVEARTLQSEAGPLKVAISLGVSTFPADSDKKAKLIEAADHALYRAKEAGRNRVQVAGPEDLA